jgi:hypothetical protein
MLISDYIYTKLIARTVSTSSQVAHNEFNKNLTPNPPSASM